MPLEVGATLGVYNVTGQIGAGGMGEVYRARDTKLDRDVALKILPDAFTNDAERLARFQREAKLLASLNHPNIGAIHGLEDSGETHALVLELVEGPTLADRIVQGPIPVDEALPIAKQIAEALEAAHEQGIIHRDLKPANIKLRSDGTVKVLDFGLAKALEGDQAQADPANSPTLTAAASQMGVILGTAAYMSPEQAKGKPVDKRTDIWAFGVVLFEMLTGRPTFGGSDISETLAAVLKTNLDLVALPSSVPHGVRRLLGRCLRKDPARRARDIGDVRLDLEEAAAAPDEDAQTLGFAAQARLALWQRPLGAMFGLLAALALGAAAATTFLGPEAPTRVVTRAGFPVGDVWGQRFGRVLAVAPDASYIVYSGPGPQLWLREADQLEARAIPGTERAAQPFLSPDGRWIGFFAPAGSLTGTPDGQLMRMEVAGGAAIPIADAPGFGGAFWDDDGTIVFASYDSELFRTGFFRVAETGGTPELLFQLQRGNFGSSPQRLPGGDWVLFTELARAGAQVVAQSVSSGERVIVIDDGRDGWYLPTGHLLYGANGVVVGLPFDAATLEILGGPVSLVQGVLARGPYQFSVAANGTLVYVPGPFAAAERTLVWVDDSGREELLPLPPAAFVAPSLSPDGTRVAIGREDTSDHDVWVGELDRGTLAPLATGPAADGQPLWSPDGRAIVFESIRDGRAALYRKAADGTGNAELLAAIDTAGRIAPSGWTPDGAAIVAVVDAHDGTERSIGLVPVDPPGEWQPLLSEQWEWYPAISPDGRWLAYASSESGRNEVYVRRFPEMTDRQPISVGGGWGAMWSADGTELFYLRAPIGPPDAMMRVAIEADGERLTAGPPEHLFDWPYFNRFGVERRYDISRSDGRFLTLKTSDGDGDLDGAARIVMVLNWTEELKARVPMGR